MGEQQKADEVLPVDVIFSCTVCHATLSDIYKCPEPDKGFRDDSFGDTNTPDKSKPVTKLWLSKCGHLTCSKHLDGGGIPFHRAGEQPRAVCPICAAETNDGEPKTIYAIRGAGDGEHDPKIPTHWFDTPPITLDGQTAGMDALRFHYLALVRLGTKLLPKLRNVETIAHDYKQQATSHAANASNMTREIEILKQRVAQLEHCEQHLKSWKDREPKIAYYLNLFTEITRENHKLREQLTALGYAVPRRTYSLSPGPNEDHERLQRHSPRVNEHAEAPEPEKSASDRTLSGPFEPGRLDHSTGARKELQSGKRNREDDTTHRPQKQSKLSPLLTREDSGSLMPPPPPPYSREQKTFSRMEASSQTRPQPEALPANGSTLLSSPNRRDAMIQDRNHGMDKRAKPLFETQRTAEEFQRESPPDLRGLWQSTHVKTGNKAPAIDLPTSPLNYISQPRRGQNGYENSHVDQHRPRLDLQQFYYNSSVDTRRSIPTTEHPPRSQRFPQIQDPKTPFPTNRTSAFPGPQSVISPFFSAAPVANRSTRLTLPHKSPMVLRDSHYSTPYSGPENRQLSGPNGVAAPQAYDSTLTDQNIRRRQKPFVPPLLNSSTRFSGQQHVFQDQGLLDPPSSPYFRRPEHRQHRDSLSSMQAAYPLETPQARYFRSSANRPPQLDILPNSRRPVREPTSADFHGSQYTRIQNATQPLGTTTGLRSGASRLSNEWIRESLGQAPGSGQYYMSGALGGGRSRLDEIVARGTKHAAPGQPFRTGTRR